MRNLDKTNGPDNDLLQELSKALVQRYLNRTDKRARYRPKNPDKKLLRDFQLYETLQTKNEKNSENTNFRPLPIMLHSVARWGRSNSETSCPGVRCATPG